MLIWRNLSTLLLWLAQAACFVTLVGIPFSDPSSTCCYLLTICVVEVIKCHDISSQIKSFVFNLLTTIITQQIIDIPYLMVKKSTVAFQPSLNTVGKLYTIM